MYIITPAYPSREHEQAARAITDFFKAELPAEAVLLVNSCARGKASPDSCLDIVVLAPQQAGREQLERAWQGFYSSGAVFRRLEGVGAYSEVHLDILSGEYAPVERDWTGGPDEFELEVGNHLAYSAPLWERGSYYRELQQAWLPYYSEDLRSQRLAMVVGYCRNNLDHIPVYAPRGLHFHLFERFYDAFQEFLQALFIARRTYPIAYNKWIREQIVDILGLPNLYPQLVELLQVDSLESDEMVARAGRLGDLLERYALQ